VIATDYVRLVRFCTASLETPPPSPEAMIRRTDIPDYSDAGAYPERAALPQTVEHSMCVRPYLKTRCIGKRLPPVLIKASEACRCCQILVVAGNGANPQSVRLHPQCRFRRIGTWEAVGCKPGRWVDGAFQQRVQGRGDRAPSTSR
jgi:L-amino acid N-acyltransferase YncA